MLPVYHSLTPSFFHIECQPTHQPLQVLFLYPSRGPLHKPITALQYEPLTTANGHQFQAICDSFKDQLQQVERKLIGIYGDDADLSLVAQNFAY